jgi:energy-coupling factor transporter ATP-binding protein EcfA2
VGFHPDLTADENLLLAGQLLGLTPDDLDARYDDIVEFAGVCHAMAEPIKHFSTGMVARLGFALASHVPCDILLVDEMLSVGDADFRDRAIERMEQLNRAGCTILLVSHDLRLVAEVCEQAVVLAQGRVVDIGPADEVVGRFGGTDLEQADPLGLHEVNPDASARLTALTVTPRVVAPGDAIDVTAVLETSGPLAGVRIDLCIAEPFTPDWVRSGDSNEVYDRSLTADSISPRPELLDGAGRWQLTASLGSRSLRAGMLDIVVVAVEELSGEIVSEARRPVRIRGRSGDRAGVDLQTEITVLS